jgi:hypothetical protein
MTVMTEIEQSSLMMIRIWMIHDYQSIALWAVWTVNLHLQRVDARGDDVVAEPGSDGAAEYV